jgi:hypothetical protein
VDRQVTDGEKDGNKMDAKQTRRHLDVTWAMGSHKKLDWLRFEQFLADVLNSKSLDDNEKVRASKEALDSFTRRGHFDPEEYFSTLPFVE